MEQARAEWRNAVDEVLQVIDRAVTEALSFHDRIIFNGYTLVVQRELENAGAEWIEKEAVVDGKLVSARNPDDIPAFNRAMIELSNRCELFAKPDCTISLLVSVTCEVSPRQWKAVPVWGHPCQKLHTDFLVILLLSARLGSYVLRGHAFTRRVLRPAGGNLNALLIIAICEVAGEDALGGAFARPAYC